MNKIKFRREPDTGRLSEQNSRKYFSMIGLALVAFVIGSYASSIAAMYILAKFFPALYGNFWVDAVVTLVCQYGVGLGACILVLSRLPKDQNPSEPLGIGGFFAALCVAFAFMWVGNFVGNYVTAIFELFLSRPVTNPVSVMVGGNAWWMNLIVYAILFPIIEELVFRKLFCDRLLPLGEGYAVFLSAFVFGLVHGNFSQFFYAFAVGLVFAGIYVTTGRLRYSMIIHMVINAVGGVFVPWVYGKIAPLMNEDKLTELLEGLTSSDEAVKTAASAELTPYLGYLLAFWFYSLALLALTVVGVVIFFKKVRRVRLGEGLLPPSKEGKIANIFCNAGVAAAIAVSAVIFVLSLL